MSFQIIGLFPQSAPQWTQELLLTGLKVLLFIIEVMIQTQRTQRNRKGHKA
jgi:hypothetical protein